MQSQAASGYTQPYQPSAPPQGYSQPHQSSAPGFMQPNVAPGFMQPQASVPPFGQGFKQ
jgi:hypothetical protein